MAPATPTAGPPLIVGAGPTGLAAALFLAGRGVSARIVDAAPAPATTSKALAVNPRSLELLEATGVSAKIVAEGRAIESMALRRDGRVLATLDVSHVHPRLRMTALPQARTEALLTEALAAHGIVPERGVKLTSLTPDGRAGLEHADGSVEGLAAPAVFAADGAHSVARHQLGLGFDGDSLPEPWKLADVRLTAPLEGPEGFVELKPHGFTFALAFDPLHWRVISTAPEPEAELANVSEVVWKSDFRISHRLASALSVGRVCLGGDAAHIHSPMGARGMNLGIEDAFVFAQCLADGREAADGGEALDGRLADYGRIRRQVDGAVVRRIRLMTKFVRGEGAFGLARRLAPLLIGRESPLQAVFLAAVSGQDHPVRTA